MLKRFVLAALGSGLLSTIVTPVFAGVFSVTPVRIYMTPKDRGVAVTLTNEGDTEVALQADINVWSQKPDGADELVLTEDLILSPPILKLAPKARQVVRLAMLTPRDQSRQMTYRMIVREVPEATAAKDSEMEVPISLALSMPVFITPPQAKREVGCRLVRAVDQTMSAVCSNSGTAYAQIRDITVSRATQSLARFEGGSYILPGASKTMPLKAEKPVAEGSAEINVVFDDGASQVFSVAVP
jgi:fimbrial chaperone protein